MNKTTQGQFQEVWARTERHLEDVLREVRALLESQGESVVFPVADSGLSQNGLGDGVAIVEEYLQHNELGLALEHLCYLFREGDLPISERAYSSLEAAGRAMQMDAAVWQGIRLAAP